MKLSTTLESSLKQLGIEFVPNESVQIPPSNAGAAGAGVEQEDWDGTEGLQDGLKKVKLSSGKVLEADFIFIGVGNKPNVSLVEKADPGALVAGLVGVNHYLKVNTPVLSHGRSASIGRPGLLRRTQLWRRRSSRFTNTNPITGFIVYMLIDNAPGYLQDLQLPSHGQLLRHWGLLFLTRMEELPRRRSRGPWVCHQVSNWLSIDANAQPLELPRLILWIRLVYWPISRGKHQRPSSVPSRSAWSVIPCYPLALPFALASPAPPTRTLWRRTSHQCLTVRNPSSLSISTLPVVRTQC